MGSIVEANAGLLDALTDKLDNYLSVGAELRLFQNDFTPDPASELTDFTEATFGGYAPIDLAAEWNAVFKVIDGKYQADTNAQEFECTGSPGQTVYGWFVVQASPSDHVRISGRFVSPIVVTPGTIFQITISEQEWSLSIIP